MHEIKPNQFWDLTPHSLHDRARWASGSDGVLRRESENPATTGARLEAIARQMRQRGGQQAAPNTTLKQIRQFAERREVALWILEAVCAHPNVPPSAVRDCFRDYFFSEAMARAFFANPIAPFVLLELPDFLTSLPLDFVQNRLLKHETMPSVMVRALAAQRMTGKRRTDSVTEAARLHIAAAGEVDPAQWQDELRAYWCGFCDRATERTRRWHVDLVEQGLAPNWAANPLPPPEKRTRQKVLEKWFAFRYALDSPETLKIARRIAPYLEPEFVVYSLRMEATEADLENMLAVADHGQGLIGRAIMRHPSVSADLIRRLARADAGRFRHDAACLLQTPRDIIAEFLQSPAPEIRRAARVHPNTPANAWEQSLKATRKFMKGEHNVAGSEFISLVWVLEHREQKGPESFWVESEQWTKRLEQVLRVTPEKMDAPVEYDAHQRTARDLLRHLSHDGNRFVRAAARAYLANPSDRFTL